MATPEDFLSEVGAEVITCPHRLKLNAILDALRELCRKTSIWQEALTPFNAVASTRTYTLTSPDANAEVVRIKRLGLTGYSPLTPITVEALDVINPTWESDTVDVAAEIAQYTQLNETTFQLVPGPSASFPNTAFYGTYVLQPLRTATLLDDFLLRHMEIVGFGAKYRLLAMSDQKWSNAALATHYLQRFHRESSKLKAVTDKGFVNADMRATAPMKFA